MKRLFRKELIENRLIPVWCALLLGLLMVALMASKVVDYKTTPQLLYGSWWFAGVLTAAGLVSREVGSESLQFLMSLPVSRRQVWLIKLSAGLFLLFVSVALTSLVCAAIDLSLVGRAAVQHLPNSQLADAPDQLINALACFGVAFSLSTLLDRPISAAMVAAVTCVALMIPAGMFMAAYSIGSLDYLSSITILVALCLPAFLAASYWSFTRGESLRTGRRFWYAAAGLLGGLALTWAPAIGGYAWFTSFHRFGSTFAEVRGGYNNPAFSPDGTRVIIEASSAWPPPNKETGQRNGADHLVILPLNGTSRPQILPAGSQLAWSPDGRYLLYSRSRDRLGLRLQSPRATLVDTKTGQEDSMFGLEDKPLDNLESASWSPDGRWLAVTSRGQATYNNHLVVFYKIATLRKFHVLVPHCAQRIDDTGPMFGWHAGGQCFYMENGGNLVAVDPAISSVQPSDTGLPQATYYSLCKLKVGCGIQFTRDPHRTLFTVLPPYVRRSVHEPPLPAAFYVVDLPAAVDAAKALDTTKRHTRTPLPELNDWLTRYGTVSIPQSYGAWMAELTPDGSCLLLQKIGNDGQHGILTVTSLDLDGKDRRPRVLPARSLPDARWWLPDGRRFCTWDPNGVLSIVDPLTGFKTSIPGKWNVSVRGFSDGYPVGVTSEGRIVVLNPQSKDVFKTVQQVIQL